MKITSLITLIKYGAVIFSCILINPLLSSAQMVGGGGALTSNSLPANSNLTEDDLYSAFSIGVIVPEGTFGQAYSFGNEYFSNLAVPFGYVPMGYLPASHGLGAKTGYNFGFSGFDALSKFQLGSNLPARFGLQLGFDFDYMPISWSNVNWSSNSMTVSTDPFYYTAFKIGPQFNINLKDNMGIGLYVTINPSLSIPGGENATYTGSSVNGSGRYTYSGTYDVSDTSSIHFNVNVSAGISFYYKALIIGIEYNWLHTKYNGAIKQNETQTYSNGGVSNPSVIYPFTSVLSTNMLKFTIGIRFGSKGKS